jgi:hypothetical protein
LGLVGSQIENEMNFFLGRDIDKIEEMQDINI